MIIFSYIFLAFAILGALDRLFGNKFGLGEEFERGFKFFTATSLSMIGIIILAPALAVWLGPVFEGFYSIFKIDPSIIPASLFANDMGGAPLAVEIAKNETIGKFNGYVVSTMLGCMISFTIPFASGVVEKEYHNDMFLGFVCGIATIPVGCIVGGLIYGIPFTAVIVDLIPVLIISILFSLGLIFFRQATCAVLKCFAAILKVIICIGLIIGIISVLLKKELPAPLDSFDSAADICVRISVTLSGAFPFVFVLGKLLKKPLAFFGKKLGIKEISALSLLATLVTNATAFAAIKDMDRRGIVVNSAFACSAAYIFGSHLAYTSAECPELVGTVLLSKFISGVASVVLALIITRNLKDSFKKTP